MANAQELELSYPWGDTLPATGRTLELAPGVRWLRMGLPFALDHINLWLLRDEIDGRAGWTVVDCGIASEPTRTAWEQIFAHELDGLPVLRVIVTHMHPDHVGLAAWIARRWSTPGTDCRVWMSATDWGLARAVRDRPAAEAGAAAAAFYAEHGLRDAESLAKVSGRGSYYASLVPELPDRYRRLMDGLVLEVGGRAWRCIAGYGHAPEHMSLYGAELGVLISGDMLLPRISTNVSVFDAEPEGNPLPLFLNSLDRYESLPADTLVLPSHGRPFRGAHQRIAQLRAHHVDRLAEVMEVCAQAPASAADVLPVLFRRPLDLHQTTFAMGEALAHLHALWLDGRLRRSRDAAGVWRFAPVVAPQATAGVAAVALAG
jgi:glyoxylase-like metal-dependent hydrolase (beta-lactamase superfamily II)